MNATADVRTAASLAEAIALADSANTVREAALLLRERFAPLRVIVVDAFDMRGETPPQAASAACCGAPSATATAGRSAPISRPCPASIWPTRPDPSTRKPPP
jgi:hypothetical protein